MDMAYELTRAIQCCTIPKGYSPHYCYIFRNPDPLKTEMKDVACSRFVTMLHPYIQKGKEATKTSKC